MGSYKQLIKSLSNKELTGIVNKIRDEKQHPEKYEYGRIETESQFWTGYHTALKQELERRRKLGKISKTAGKPKKARQMSLERQLKKQLWGY